MSDSVFTKPPHQSFQIIGIAVSVASMIIYIYYFMNVSLRDHSYISDNLHRDFSFRVGTTFILVVQSILFTMYFLRFRNVQYGVCITGIVFVVVSLAGWLLLISIYTLPWHMVGFGVFVAALLIYWGIILLCDKLQFQVETTLYFYLFAAFLFVLVYSTFYVFYNDISWFYEHLGMILATICNTYFFIHHDPDPQQVFLERCVDINHGRPRIIPVNLCYRGVLQEPPPLL